MTLGTFLPQDRLRALARGESLPDRASGSVLFADISGFTHLTEALRESRGPRRGASELTRYLNTVYTALIDEVEKDGGNVIGFAGDSITCWFDDAAGPAAPRATHCAFTLQQAMSSVPQIVLPDGTVILFALKVTVATGPVRRFTVGDPSIRILDTLVGATVTRASTAEHLAAKGEVLVDEATVRLLGDSLAIREWREDHTLDQRFAVASDFAGKPTAPVLEPALSPPPASQLQPWINHAVYEREQAGQEPFLTEFRPCVALFVRFLGIDYDSNEAEEQLDTVIRRVQLCTERHQGTFLQVTIGDKGSYAYINFGALSAHENDARRAVKTALDLKKAAEELSFLGPLQIGITQGVMRVGTCGGQTRREYCAIGDDVNLAARLMTMASPGEILISGRLRKAIAADFIIVEARPSMPIKGRTELLPVFAVLGLGHQRAIRLQEPAYALVMIGRNREMALLGEKLGAVLQGRGQIVGVTAEAGMGKSRLVAEGIRLARRSGLVGYGGACQSEGTNTPYLVWQPIWNAFFDLDPSLPLRKQIRSLEGELEERVPEHVDALPLLGNVLGLSLPENDFTQPLQPKDRKTQLETMLVKCLESAAREAAEDRGGLLLVLEDLHWIDPVSFDLLELIARAIEQLPVLILLTYRAVDASLQGKNLTRLDALDHFSQIKLEDLNAEETEQVIRSKLFHLFPERGGLIPRLLIERITSRAQGNPFYVEELLNYLHDRGIEMGDAQALEKLDLPTSLYSLILSRIDQLATSQQLTLKVASIIGRIFRFDDLHHYYPPLGIAEQLQADLTELERLELTPLESPEPELTYLFKHLVTHEVSYESLSFTTRAQLHGQYAHYLERAYPERVDQFAPQLAHHFERGQIQEKARFYLMKAGERAAANFANEEALAYFNRALDSTLPGDIQGRFDTLLRREGVFDLQGRHVEQRQDLAELARLANELEEPSFPRALIATRRAKMEIDVGNHPAAISSAQAAIQEIEVEGCTHPDAPNLLVDALLLEARAMFLAGQALATRPQLERALRLARQQHYIRGEYNALAQQGLLNWHAGDYRAATELLRQSLDLIQQAGDIRRELEILNNLGIVAKAKSQPSEAIRYYEQAQRIANKIGDRSGAATLLNNMGSACLISGDFALAASYSEQAAAMAVEVNELTLQGMALTNCGESYRELGQYERANIIAAEALALSRASGYRRGEAIVLDNMGLADISLGNYAQARERIQAALDLAREIGSRYTESYALLHLGSIYTETGQFEAAEQALIAAQQILQEDEDMTRLEVQPRLANLMLARGGDENVERAYACVSALISLLLQEAPPDKTLFLPLWSYLTCIRVLQARHDPRAAQLLVLAKAELRLRSEKITDTALRQGYLNIPEHTAILNLASAFSLPEI